MPTVFTPFRQKVEGNSSVRPVLPGLKRGDLGSVPADALEVAADADRVRRVERVEDLGVGETPAKDARAAFAMAGGETVALERLEYYLFGSNLVSNYFNIRNGMLGGDYSTKLAPVRGCETRPTCGRPDAHSRSLTHVLSLSLSLFRSPGVGTRVHQPAHDLLVDFAL